MYRERQYLEERLNALRDMHQHSIGDTVQPLVCRVCYSPFDHRGCLCDRCDWIAVALALTELELLLQENVTPKVA